MDALVMLIIFATHSQYVLDRHGLDRLVRLDMIG
jgi:hypothetical protein